MKHIFALLTLATVCLTAYCRADVHWLETRHNFGAFDEDFGPATTEFKFVNTGDEPYQSSARTHRAAALRPNTHARP